MQKSNKEHIILSTYIMGDLVYLDPCNKRFVDKYTKLASVPRKQSTKPSKATIYSFAVNY